jgi:branched-chain amino acid transport system permease protein
METLILDAVTVLSTAGWLFIVSAGLNLVFGAMRLINVAHGSFYMLGGLIMASLAAGTGELFWIALVLATLLVALIGSALEIVVLRRIYHKEHLVQLVATFAMLLIISDLASTIWGRKARTVNAPSSLTGTISVGGADFPAYRLVIIGAAILVAVGLWLMLTKTALGWRTRAAVEDPELLAGGGTNLTLLRTGTFALGVGLAAFAGAVVSPSLAVGPGSDTSIIVAAFIVTVIGGLGSIPGAAIGALVIGLAQTIGTSVAPGWAATSIYLAMILVLAFRPSGLLGVQEQ